MFGVLHGDLHKIRAQIKCDHQLALELWDSGNVDARNLATMIADPSQMTSAALTKWMKDVTDHGVSSILSNVAQRSPAATKTMRKWMARKGELVASTGWLMLAGIARERPEILSKAEYEEFLATIEDEIHGAKNRVKYSMNLALISIGSYVMEKAATTIAKRVGEVEVDHGDTSCKTPLAAPYIKKAAAHERAKAAKLAARKKAR